MAALFIRRVPSCAPTAGATCTAINLQRLLNVKTLLIAVTMLLAPISARAENPFSGAKSMTITMSRSHSHRHGAKHDPHPRHLVHRPGRPAA